MFENTLRRSCKRVLCRARNGILSLNEEEGMAMAVEVPSPAVSIVGRHNSGKTTLIERVIAELVARGHDVGSVNPFNSTGVQLTGYPWCV